MRPTNATNAPYRVKVVKQIIKQVTEQKPEPPTKEEGTRHYGADCRNCQQIERGSGAERGRALLSLLDLFHTIK